jgi:hypothetical protein
MVVGSIILSLRAPQAGALAVCRVLLAGRTIIAGAVSNPAANDAVCTRLNK